MLVSGVLDGVSLFCLSGVGLLMATRRAEVC